MTIGYKLREVTDAQRKIAMNGSAEEKEQLVKEWVKPGEWEELQALKNSDDYLYGRCLYDRLMRETLEDVLNGVYIPQHIQMQELQRCSYWMEYV